MAGKFITFEGIDGSGKSTQIDLLEKKLISENIPYIVFREPGGTKLSEKIREILLDRNIINLCPSSESLLFVAARTQLMSEKIKPALENNQFVICDRFADSTVAYQGYGRGVSVNYLEELNNFGTCNIKPDLTILLDIDPQSALQRLKDSSPDRMEAIGREFFQKVQNGYYKIASQHPDRYVIIDGQQSESDVFKTVYNEISKNILKEMLCN